MAVKQLDDDDNDDWPLFSSKDQLFFGKIMTFTFLGLKTLVSFTNILGKMLIRKVLFEGFLLIK